MGTPVELAGRLRGALSFSRGRRSARRALLLAVLTVCTLPAPAAGRPQTPDPLLPDTVFETPDRPRMVLFRDPGVPVVALRLSVPIREGASEAGAGEIIQQLGVRRARGQARTLGARVRGVRTPTGIAYTVEGPATDLDYLAYILRLAVQEPELDRVAFGRIRGRLLAEAREAEETASGRIAAELRKAVAPGEAPLGGTVASLQALSPSVLRDVWTRTHQPDEMSLIVVGDVPIEVLLVSFQALGGPEPAVTLPPDDDPLSGRRNRTQILRHWFGEARVLGDSQDPRGAVAALLVARRLRELELGPRSGFEAEVRLWDVAGRKSLAVIGAAYARSARAMRGHVTGALETTLDGLDDAAIEAAVAQIRRDLAFSARTPGGKASLVGRHLDATGSVRAARDYAAALDGITPGSLREFLAELADQRPVRAEVRP